MARPSGGGRNLVFAFRWAGRTGAAARTARRFLLGFDRLRFIAADGRRKHVERDRLATVHPSPVAFGILACPGFVALFAPGTALTIEALAAILALRTLLGGDFFASLGELLVTFVFVDLVLTPRALFLEARAILAEHAEIMVGVLKIIFGLDPIARELRVPSHALVFFEQLSGIAALAIVLAVARLAAEIPTAAPLSSATAPAAALSIVDQNAYVLTQCIIAPSPQAGRAALIWRGSDPLVPVSRSLREANGR
jgi:hypothetical protein